MFLVYLLDRMTFIVINKPNIDNSEKWFSGQKILPSDRFVNFAHLDSSAFFTLIRVLCECVKVSEDVNREQIAEMNHFFIKNYYTIATVFFHY